MDRLACLGELADSDRHCWQDNISLLFEEAHCCQSSSAVKGGSHYLLHWPAFLLASIQTVALSCAAGTEAKQQQVDATKGGASERAGWESLFKIELWSAGSETV
jgi:hypothetical protein